MNKFANIVKLLVALAMVCSLVAIVAAPAGAIPAGYTVTNTPTTTGATAQYAIGPFTVAPGGNNSYIAGTDTFTVTFPAGTTVPATIGRLSVAVTNNTAGETGNPPFDPIVSGQSVTVTVPALTLGGAGFSNIADGDSVTIVFMTGAGIKNPGTVASTWTLTVSGVYSGGVPGTEAAATSAAYTTTAPAATVSLSPSAASRGTSFTVNGSSFTAGTTATVTVKNGIHGTTILGFTSVGTDGKVAGSYIATVPPFASGANTITVTDGAGKTGSATFTLTAGISISPTSARPGDTITVLGTDTGGVAGNDTTIGGVNVTHAAQGAGWTSFTVTVPGGLAPGTVKVVVPDTNGTGQADLLIQGSPVNLTPTSGSQGTQVTISGSGFTPSSTVDIKFGGVAWASGVAVTSGGDFLTVQSIGAAQQSLGPGTWTVMVTDSGTPPRTGSASFTIPERTLVLSPTESGSGSGVLATGTGFSPNTMFSMVYGTLGTVVTGMTDGVGSFIASFAVPISVAPNTTYTVTATDANNLSKSATHKVPSSAVTISPTSGGAGTPITISLTGFPPFATVTSAMIGIASVLPSPVPYTNAAGSVSFTAIVPAIPAGPVLVSVTAGGITGSTSFSVTTAPPSVASALSTISNKLVRVWGWSDGTWLLYDPADEAGSTLKTLTPGDGYWINVSEACTLIYGAYVYELDAGWNLKGWR
jgi:hypothetical protein